MMLNLEACLFEACPVERARPDPDACDVPHVNATHHHDVSWPHPIDGDDSDYVDPYTGTSPEFLLVTTLLKRGDEQYESPGAAEARQKEVDGLEEAGWLQWDTIETLIGWRRRKGGEFEDPGRRRVDAPIGPAHHHHSRRQPRQHRLGGRGFEGCRLPAVGRAQRQL